MNDEQMQRTVGSWLNEGDLRPPPDARHSVREAMARMPQVRQRSRWWPFPVLYRRVHPSTITDTDYHSSPIPATNGHTPTVIGRTQSMLSPAKAITAGALVFAIGGALIIAQPFEQRSSGPGAEVETPTPVPFTARFEMAGQANAGETETLDNAVERTSRVAWRANSIEASDPRFEGTWVWTITWDSYPDVEFNTGAGRIENDEGAWQELPERFFNWTDGRDTPSDNLMMEGETAQRVFVGEDGYEGLIAVAIETAETNQGSVWSLDGYILDGELPPLPEPYVAE